MEGRFNALDYFKETNKSKDRILLFIIFPIFMFIAMVVLASTGPNLFLPWTHPSKAEPASLVQLLSTEQGQKKSLSWSLLDNKDLKIIGYTSFAEYGFGMPHNNEHLYYISWANREWIIVSGDNGVAIQPVE